MLCRQEGTVTYVDALRPEKELLHMGASTQQIGISGQAVKLLGSEASDQLLSHLEEKLWLPCHTAAELGLLKWSSEQQSRSAAAVFYIIRACMTIY